MSFEEMRDKMISQQIEARGVNDSSVIEAMRSVRRELYVSKEVANIAYSDTPLPIGYGQTISQPYIVARMTELLQVRKDCRVLEIGTGSGYQAAVLSRLASKVFSMERIRELKVQAQSNIDKEGIKNVFIITGDGTIGMSQYAPFDRIIVTAASPEIPKILLEQLANNGIMIIPLGSISLQTLVRVTKKDDKFFKEEFDGCTFVPLIGKYGFKI